MPATPCAIALGANLGDPRATFDAALALLDRQPGLAVTARSPWYRTPPLGPPQPDYLNGCALLDACLEPHGVLRALLAVEARLGRTRGERWGPRVLDLDLLLYGDRLVAAPDADPPLQVPHPHLRDRAFVLRPLADIAPDWVDPVSGRAIADLLRAVDCSGIAPA